MKEPKIIYKGTQTFRHDLFRLKVTELLRNNSFKKGNVQLEKIPHVHFFHTFDSNGRPQKYSTPAGGHFHEVTWQVDEKTGELVATCGPALQYVYKKRAGGQKRYLEGVKWEDEVNDSLVVDSHTHECEYAWSEELSSKVVQARRDAGAKIAEQQVRASSRAKSLGLESGLD